MGGPDAGPAPATGRLSVLEVLRRFTAGFVAKCGQQATRHVQGTLAKLAFCRTKALGDRRYRCVSCQHESRIYNSCVDRHCPQCGGARRANWLDKAGQLLLPSTTYFQVVFTLPDQLSALALGNRREMYKLLFHTAWSALRDSVREECSFEPAALMVLHTWNQRLDHHPHVHALVPGSGPSEDGSRWTPCRQTRGTRSTPSKPFLVDNKRLSERFKKRFLTGLKSLHRHGKLRLEGSWERLSRDGAFTEYLEGFRELDWVVFIQPPPSEKSSPAHVLKYLARYMTGGPIADSRLIALESNEVRFWARKNVKGKSPSREPVTLGGVEFVRRWSLHILPKGFMKTRCYGGYSNRHRKLYLARSEQLYRAYCDAQPPTSASEPAEVAKQAIASESPAERTCPHCQHTMVLISERRKPSWEEVLYGPDRLRWFESG